MKYFNFKTDDQTASACASSIVDTVNQNSNAQICYATGNSVVKLYQFLVELANCSGVDFTHTKAFQLDEYYQLLANDSLYMKHIILDLATKLGVESSNQYVHQVTLNPTADINYYRNAIQRPFDLMVLGVGVNGHLAYNEPGSDAHLDLQILKLEPQSTINTLGYGFSTDDELPTAGITIGLKTIVTAKKIVLIALGDSKQPVIEKLLGCTQYNPQFPVSILHNHPNLEIYTDFEIINGEEKNEN